jgi:hypothetical protein
VSYAAAICKQLLGRGDMRFTRPDTTFCISPAPWRCRWMAVAYHSKIIATPRGTVGSVIAGVFRQWNTYR